MNESKLRDPAWQYISCLIGVASLFMAILALSGVLQFVGILVCITILIISGITLGRLWSTSPIRALKTQNPLNQTNFPYRGYGASAQAEPYYGSYAGGYTPAQAEPYGSYAPYAPADHGGFCSICGGDAASEGYGGFCSICGAPSKSLGNTSSSRSLSSSTYLSKY